MILILRVFFFQRRNFFRPKKHHIYRTNSGISAIIYPDGSEEARLPYGVIEKLDAELKLKDRTPTLYERFGLMITIVVALILFGLAIGLEKSLRAKGHANE